MKLQSAKYHIIILMLLNSALFAQLPDYGKKDFYLIDSLDLNLLTKQDKNYLDSCLHLYHKFSNDTSKVNALMLVVDNVWNDRVWPRYNFYLMNEILNAPPKNRSDAENKFFKKKLAETLNNEGYYYRHIGNIPVALDYYHQSLKVLEELKDSVGMSFLYNNLGAIYQHQANLDMSLKYHYKSLDLKIALNDSAGMSHTFNNIGVVYERLDSLEKAMVFFQKGLALYLKNNDVRGASRGYYNIGHIYAEWDSLELSKWNYEKSLAGYYSYGDEEGISMTSSGLGRLEIKMGNFHLAKQYAETGLKYARELGHPDVIRYNASVLYDIALNIGDYKTALEMRNLEIQMQDSLENTAYIKMSADTEAKYEFEKQQAIKDTEHRAEIEKQQTIADAAKKRQNIIIVAISVGLIIVIIFTIFLTNRFRVTQRQKQIIETQKHEVEEKNKEILDSIRYAKRIQNAILPSMEAMNQALKDGFVLYKPKDVVAGDFYWMEKVDQKVFVAAADCTGHGVPGAMVSVVCSNALSKALLEENADSTGNLLDRTREIVINRLAKSGEEMKDGMDVSLCSIDFNKMELQWSGANNPLWVIRPASSDLQADVLSEVIEFKADKQPVGMHSSMKPFTTHRIEIFKGDCIYLFTDGYQDQFGGQNGKKFKASKLKEKLVEINTFTMDQQFDILEQEFENWKKGFEQVDDVCLIGVRI